MVMGVQNQITQMKTATAVNESKKDATTGTEGNDKNMFLKLMLQQLEYQDPTEPTSNEQWLSQLAQYSSLEEMQNMNQNFSSMKDYVSAIQESIGTSASITQTLSLIGKDVTLEVPNAEDETKKDTITGKVTEASFDDGVGQIKIDGKNYSIGYITAIRESSN